MQVFLVLQIAAYVAAAAVGVVNSPYYQQWQEAQQEQEPPAIVEAVEDVPELEEVAEDG